MARRELELISNGTVKGSCPLDCQDGCAWVAEVKDGRVTRVSGAKDHPITRGALCAKVNDYQERVYAPDRLLQPLVRTGPKGAAEFREASWDEALDLVAERFQSIAREHGPAAVVTANYAGSMGLLQRHALTRMFNAFGATPTRGSVCGRSGVSLLVEGHPIGFDPEEMPEAELILVWGANPLSTAHHAWPLMAEARERRGARIITIDPIRTRTARASDEHISLRPGTDHILAAGLVHVLFAEGLADLDYASAAADDVDALRMQVEPWTPEAVEAGTDIPAATVVRLARAFAAARPALIRCGVGVQQSRWGDALVRLLSALAILGGHWRHRGGGLFLLTGPELDGPAVARSDWLPEGARKLDLARLGEVLTDTELSPPAKAFVAWTINPLVTQIDAERLRAGLQREDLFTVVLEHFMTDTARYADVVLPSTTQLEHLDICDVWGHHYITLNEPAIAPQGKALSHSEIARRLARRLGLDRPGLYASDEELLAAALPDGLTLEGLRTAGWVKHGQSVDRSGVIATGLRLAGEEPIEAPPRDGKLQLLTPKSHYFMNSTFANMRRQRSKMKRPTLQMHPDDAAARGLDEGQAVNVSSSVASLRAWIELTDVMHPGVVALPGKWWSRPTETDAVANTLNGPGWSRSGQPTFNDLFVDVRPAQG